MKLFILLLLIPVLGFSNADKPASHKFTSTPNAVVTTAFSNMSAVLKNSGKEVHGKTIYAIAKASYMLEDIKIKEGFAGKTNDVFKELTLVLNQAEGLKLQALLVEEYGQPLEEFFDNYQWTINNMSIEIKQQGKDFIATYTVN